MDIRLYVLASPLKNLAAQSQLITEITGGMPSLLNSSTRSKNSKEERWEAQVIKVCLTSHLNFVVPSWARWSCTSNNVHRCVVIVAKIYGFHFEFLFTLNFQEKNNIQSYEHERNLTFFSSKLTTPFFKKILPPFLFTCRIRFVISQT